MQHDADRLGYKNPTDIMELPRLQTPSVQCGRCDRTLANGDNCQTGTACKRETDKHVFCETCYTSGCPGGSQVLVPPTFGPNRGPQERRGAYVHMDDPFPTQGGTQISATAADFCCIGCIRLAAPAPNEALASLIVVTAPRQK